MEKKFLVENEISSHEFALKTIWASIIIQFPIGFCLSLLHVLKVKPYLYIISLAITVPVNLLFRYFIKRHLLISKLKYLIILFLLLDTSYVNYTYGNDVSMQVVWLFPIIISCLYFDRRLTLLTAVGVGFCAISLYQLAPILEKANEPSDLLITIGLLTVLVVVMLILLVGRVYHIFMSLMDAEERAVLLEKLNKVLNQSQEVASQLNSTVEVFAEASEQVGKSVNQIASNTNQVSLDVVEVMEQTGITEKIVVDLVDTSEMVSTRSSRVNESISESITKLDKAVATIANSLSNVAIIDERVNLIFGTVDELLNRSREIKEVNIMLNRIVKQTNLLALNASIEAARAGTEGRSFSIIAKDVRELSENAQGWNNKTGEVIACIEQVIQKVAEDITEIKKVTNNELLMTRDAQQELQGISEIHRQNNQAIQELGSMVKELMSKIREIPSAVQIISTAIRSISGSVENTAASSEETAASMEELVANAQHLQSMADSLKKVIEY